MSGEELTLQNACGCCDGVSIQSPMLLYNRPGLAAVAYRIGTHSEVLASLQARLSSQEYPALAKLRTRDSDDFSIALLDAYACMADVLSFYQERLANESYLRTAGERLSLSELARLIGYRLKPGVAAETWLAFTLQEAPPQAASNEPKQVSGVPDIVTLVTGIKVQSIPGPDEKPQTFETIESIEARPAWNVLRPRLSQSYLPAEGRSDCWFQGINLNIKAGDALLFIGNEYLSNSDKSRWQFRVINSVLIDSENQRTQVSWSSALDNKTPGLAIQGHLLRRRTAVFGHNAPMWATMHASFKDLYEPLSGSATHSTDWPAFYISALDGAVDTDALYADAKSGQWCVLTTGSFTAPFNITSVSEVTRAHFALAGKVTRLALAGDNYASFKSEVRSTTVYTVSEQLVFAEAPLNTIVSNDNVVLNKMIEGMQAGRKLMFAGFATDTNSNQVEVVTLKTHTAENGLSKLTLSNNLLHSYQRVSLSIYANIARATHGETVQETIGSGAGRNSHQRFTLKHAPLTFVGAENETGAESTLEVRVNDISWHETATLFGTAPDDRSYVLRVGEDGAATIQFGDGRRGARLPTGQDNVRAIYRKGIGAAGNLQAGQLSQLLSRPLGLKTVSNPLPAAGGVDADKAEHARRNMPLGVRTLGRVVSLQDYEDYALAYTGIAKAQASVLNTRARRTVFITVAGDGDGSALDPTLSKLLNALKQNGDPLLRCDAAPCIEVKFKLGLRVKRHPDYAIETVLKNVEKALRDSFSFTARDFGQIVSRSEVIAVAQQVKGVLGVDLDRFYRGTYDPDNPLQERLIPASAEVDALGNTVAAELLLLDNGAFDSLEEMP